MYTSIGNLPDSMHKALQSSGVELHFRNLDACVVVVVVFFFLFVFLQNEGNVEYILGI